MSHPSVYLSAAQRPNKRRRRTATSVLAGDFDPRPPRDVLTSLLNGVGPYKLVEKDDEERRVKKRERREREKEKRRLKHAARRAARAAGAAAAAGSDAPQGVQQGGGRVARAGSFPGMAESASGSSTPTMALSHLADGTPAVNASTSSFWRSRGPIIHATRSVSPTPPPPDLFAPPTPGPSVSSTASRTSRPLTPDDLISFSYFDAHDSMGSSPPPPRVPKLRKKRSAARKGWKGWVEGSPPPSDKLINLDYAPVMTERRTRSGKNFDAISEGQDSWINLDH